MVPRATFQMVWRPTIEQHLNQQIRLHPRLNVILKRFHPDEDNPNIPKLFCYSNQIGAGGIKTEAITISCVINNAPTMNELLGSEDFQCNYDYVLYGFTQVCGQKDEMESMKLNNDHANSVQGIHI
jgi:hypothetical protein